MRQNNLPAVLVLTYKRWLDPVFPLIIDEFLYCSNPKALPSIRRHEALKQVCEPFVEEDSPTEVP